MLVISLVVSAMVLAIANLIAAKSRQPIPGILAVCGVAFFGPFCIGLGLPAVLLQCLGLGLLSVVWWICSARPASFSVASCLVTLLAYLGIWCLIVSPHQSRYQALRKSHPLEDMTVRVRAPRPLSHSVFLSESSGKRLMDTEEQLDRWNSRKEMLKQLHEKSTYNFINSYGFGVGRMVRPNEYSLRLDEDELSQRPQPGERETSASTETAPPYEVRDVSRFDRMHSSSLTAFFDSRLFGFVKNRQNVAGFKSHQFVATPDSPAPWKLQTLDLVGLLMHEEPVAYVSEHLPKMDELRDAPTRPLDAFEDMGLKEIQKGEDLYARESGNTVRLLGAIRATKQCTTCHACERGDLLGAFSYTLKRSGEE